MGVISAHNELLSEPDHLEYERRIERLREILDKESLDGVIVSDRRYDPDNPPAMTAPPYARYLSNMTLYGGGGGAAVWAHRANPLVVASRSADPVLVLPPGLRNSWVSYARHRSWIVDVKCAGENRVWASNHDFPSNSGVISPDDIAEAIEQSGLSRGRIGISGNWPDMHAIADRFPGAEFVPVIQPTQNGRRRDVLEPLIGANSEWEIARLERAQIAANVAIEALRTAAKGGATVREAGREGRLAAIRAGADELSVDGSVIAEPWTFAAYDLAPESLTFERGKLYLIEIAYCMVDGYSVQTCRLFTVGEPEPEVQRMYDTAMTSLHAMLNKLSVGVTGADMWDAGIGPLQDGGYAPWCRLGHSCGFEMFGPQRLQFFPGDRYQVEPHQAVTVHAPIVSGDGNTVGIIGDTVLAIEDGWRYFAPPADYAL
ncbi:MAG TPA: M24 family metallopeptidase [Jatrophihabitans sp.]|jgi:Xaa-Pro aminopeptidase